MRIIPTLFLMAMPGLAVADAPKVVTSVKPVFDLVATVMNGIGKPELLLARNESVHHASLRPSRLRSLQEADLIVLIGENLEPWLTSALDVLAEPSTVLRLSDVAGATLLDIRQPATLASDEEQELAKMELPEEPQPEEDSDFFDDSPELLESDLEDEAAAAANSADADLILDPESADSPFTGIESDEHEHEHEHGTGHDPHVWLDPKNAAIFLEAIAVALSRADPENTESYHANAENARIGLADAVLQVKDRLAELTDTRFVYNHDSFQYFEKSFGLKSIGATNTADGKQVGARTVSGITSELEFAPVTCLIIDRSESARSVRTLFENMESKVLDPMGLDLTPGKGYPASLFLALAEGFAECD